MPTERLTALDASFLYLERPAMHMHVAGLSVLDPSTRPDGRLRFEDVERLFASRLHMAPRLRQKVKMVPYGLALPAIGFLPASIAFVAALTAWLALRASEPVPVAAVVVSACIVAGLCMLFQHGFSVPLPAGAWWGGGGAFPAGSP